MAHQNQLSSCTAETTLTSDSPGSNLHTDSDKYEAVIPSELITSCIATKIMIKVTCGLFLGTSELEKLVLYVFMIM